MSTTETPLKTRAQIRADERRQHKQRRRAHNRPNLTQDERIQDDVLTPGSQAWRDNVVRITSEQDSFLHPDQQFILLQWFTEGNRTAVKFKGAFATVEEGQRFVDEMRPYDNNQLFDTALVHVGRWMCMPPRKQDIDNMNISYDNPELQRIMDSRLRHQLDDYNSVQSRINYAQRHARSGDTYKVAQHQNGEVDAPEKTPDNDKDNVVG